MIDQPVGGKGHGEKWWFTMVDDHNDASTSHCDAWRSSTAAIAMKCLLCLMLIVERVGAGEQFLVAVCDSETKHLVMLDTTGYDSWPQSRPLTWPIHIESWVDMDEEARFQPFQVVYMDLPLLVEFHTL